MDDVAPLITSQQVFAYHALMPAVVVCWAEEILTVFD